MASRADYLKKYLSGPTDDGAKKKRRKVASKKSLVIHDDDADWNKVQEEEDEENKPQLVNPFEVKEMDSEEEEDEEAIFRRAFQPIGGEKASLAYTKEGSAPEAPQARGRKRHDSPDLDVPRKRHDSPDLDVPRKRHDSPDLDVPRKRHDSPDLDVPRKRHDSPDLDVLRKRAGSPDLDVPRKRSEGKGDSKRSEGRGQRAATAEVLSLGVGLVQGKDIKLIYEQKAAQEAAMLKSLSAEEAGLGQETVHRDVSGNKLEPKLERLRKRQEQQKELEKAEKQMQWGRGVAQVKMREEKMREDLHEMAKPVARHADDEDLNKMQKEQLLLEDPMRMYILNKKDDEAVKAGEAPKPKYKGPLPPPNRFAIPPGFRWDGVNRSNGFDARKYNRESTAKAWKEAEYKWRSEDL